MPTGRVKFFNPDRGFGFITPDGGEFGTARDGRSKAINLRLLNPDGHHGAD